MVDVCSAYMRVEGSFCGKDPLLVRVSLHLSLHGDHDTLHLCVRVTQCGVGEAGLHSLVGYSQNQLSIGLRVNVTTLQETRD